MHRASRYDAMLSFEGLSLEDAPKSGLGVRWGASAGETGAPGGSGATASDGSSEQARHVSLMRISLPSSKGTASLMRSPLSSVPLVAPQSRMNQRPASG